MKKMFLAGIAAMAMVFGMTGCGDSNVDHSSKEAVIQSLVKAAQSDDASAAKECFSERVKDSVDVQGWMRDAKGGIPASKYGSINCKQIDGKWYIDEK